MKPFNRRRLLGAAGLMAMGGMISRLPASAQEIGKGPGKGPVLGCFDVKNYGATGNGSVLDSAAINRAIDDCHALGGGLVFVPPGTYLCGTVVLKSNITLYLEAGATLLGSKNLADYTPQSLSPNPSEKTVFTHDIRDTSELHLVFARDAENIGLGGPGKIDGQGSAYWQPSGRAKRPAEDGWRDVIAFDWKAGRRPSPMLEFYNCRNLRIEDVRIENSAGWTLRPICCDNVFIRGISIKNPVYGPNTDGLDPTCCRNVFISDCLIDTGDDAICLKSEDPYGGGIRVSKNITITNCVLSGCCNGLKFGTSTYGGYENIMFTNSVIFNDDVSLNSRVIAGIALEMVDGGSIEGVIISNIRMQRVRTPIFIHRGNRHARADGTPGILRGVMIENIHATEAVLTSSITGLDGFDVEDVALSGIRIDTDEAGKAEWMKRTISEAPEAYPESRMFGRLPSYGFYCRHVKGLRLRQVEFKAAAGEERPAIFCDDVKDLEISGLRSTPTTGVQPFIKLVQTGGALIQACVAPAKTQNFLEVQGGQTRQVALMNNNLMAAQKTFQAGPGVPAGAVTAAGNIGGQG
jgi:hypothetical protein